MKSVPSLVLMMALLLASCAGDDGDERRASWNEVHDLRAAYLSASPEQRRAAKQRWADGVREHLERWPEDPGAVRTWNDLQLDYAEQLEANGHFAEAERHYEDLLRRLPGNPRVAERLERVRRRQTLSRDDFQKLRKGMTTRQVADFLGLPRPGWDQSSVRDGSRIDSWYYREVTGTVRGIHFRDGALFEIDPD